MRMLAMLAVLLLTACAAQPEDRFIDQLVAADYPSPGEDTIELGYTMCDALDQNRPPRQILALANADITRQELADVGTAAITALCPEHGDITFQ